MQGSTGFPKAVTHSHHSIPLWIPLVMQAVVNEEKSAEWVRITALSVTSEYPQDGAECAVTRISLVDA